RCLSDWSSDVCSSDLLQRLTGIFGSENVYVELQRHYDRVEEDINQHAIALAETVRLPVLATNGVRYATPDARETLDVFTCIRNRSEERRVGKECRCRL